MRCEARFSYHLCVSGLGSSSARAAGIIHRQVTSTDVTGAEKLIFLLHFRTSAPILDISCALPLDTGVILGCIPLLMKFGAPRHRLSSVSPPLRARLHDHSRKTKTRAKVGLEEQMLLNNVTVRRNQDCLFERSPLRLAQVGAMRLKRAARRK